MNIRFLIDSITQQTTVLIAQLATTGGVRAPLAHIANQVFLDLSKELNTLGVTRKVAADMFGMALRSYHAKIRRLEESATEPVRRSLWEAVYDFVDERGPVAQQEVLTRFRYDSDALVRGVLFDLVENNLVYQSGSQDDRIYRCVPDSEIQTLVESRERDSMYWGIWMYIYRNGPILREELEAQLKSDSEHIAHALEALTAQGRITAQTDGALVSAEIYIPIGEPAGWEAALFDHFSAMTTAIVTKLRETRLQTMPSDEVGGSTYTFDVWDGHPMRDDVRSLLRTTRAQMSALNDRVRAYNDAHIEDAPEALEEVLFYLGQAVIQRDTRDDEESM